MKIWIAGAALLLASCSTDSGGSDDAKDDSPDVGDEVGAQVVCKDFVEKRLKSPDSADFKDEQVTQISGPTWQVVGAVDSENSFGASIRNNYTCRVKYKGDDKWTLVKMTGLNN